MIMVLEYHNYDKDYILIMPYKIGHPLQLLQADIQIVTSYRNDAYENKKT